MAFNDVSDKERNDDLSVGRQSVPGAQEPVPGSRDPVMSPAQSQAQEQQRMNAEAATQARQQPVQQRNNVFVPDPNNKDDPRGLPGFLFPTHAAPAMTRLAVTARKQEADGTDPGIPDSAKPVSPLDMQFVDMPAGGLATLAHMLYPDDFNNRDAMDKHVHDLLIMNRDSLRDDTTFTVGQRVRVK